jgi:hypothetical protein
VSKTAAIIFNKQVWFSIVNICGVVDTSWSTKCQALRLANCRLKKQRWITISPLMVLQSKLMQLRLHLQALVIMTKVWFAESDINSLEFQLYLSRYPILIQGRRGTTCQGGRGLQEYSQHSFVEYSQLLWGLSFATTRAVWCQEMVKGWSEKAQHQGKAKRRWMHHHLKIESIGRAKIHFNLTGNNIITQLDRLFSLVRDDGEFTFPHWASQCCQCPDWVPPTERYNCSQLTLITV